jgi:DNA-binding MarR family transcriptional regulator
VRDSVDRQMDLWSKELDWLDPVKDAIFGRLMILARYSTQARRDNLHAGRLGHGQFKVLLMLRRLGSPYTASPSQLADLLGLTRGALSARLASLETEGMIRRTHEAGDRRRVRVQLTPAGSDAFEQQAVSEGNAEDTVLTALTDDELQVLADLLRRLVVAVETNSSSDVHR